MRSSLSRFLPRLSLVLLGMTIAAWLHGLHHSDAINFAKTGGLYTLHSHAGKLVLFHTTAPLDTAGWSIQSLLDGPDDVITWTTAQEWDRMLYIQPHAVAGAGFVLAAYPEPSMKTGDKCSLKNRSSSSLNGLWPFSLQPGHALKSYADGEA
jgi:hypothetical protein